MSKTICLCMIVKNEAKTIARCFASVRDIIDTWLIIDTGSSDGTQNVVRQALQEIPGELLERPWVNFGHNRTELVSLARGRADYLLLLDADMEAVIEDGFRKNFDADAYVIRYTGSIDYGQQLFVRADLNWAYVGVTHEYIHCPQAKTVKQLDGLKITHHGDGGMRSDKFQRDIQLLEAELERDPKNPRNVFYLAQSYRDIGNLPEAIRLYQQRSEMGGWVEESWYATYQAGLLSLRNGRPEEAQTWLLKAFQFRPTRAEPLFALCEHFRKSEKYSLGHLFGTRALRITYPNDVLFVDRSIYEYRLLDELSICAHYVGEYSTSLRLCDQLLKGGKLPANQTERIIRNRQFSISCMTPMLFGLGVDRTSLERLATSLREQPNVDVSMDTQLLPWNVDMYRLDELLRHLQSRPRAFVCELADYLLPYVERILKTYPNSRFVCLKSDRDEAIISCDRRTRNLNHWTRRDSDCWMPEWKADERDECYPKFDADKRNAIGRFWDQYYQQANYLQSQYPERFRILEPDSIESEVLSNEIDNYLFGANGTPSPDDGTSPLSSASETDAESLPTSLTSGNTIGRSETSITTTHVPREQNQNDSETTDSSQQDRVAICITNYNMPEATDNLVEHIHRTVQWPHDIIVIDNASDLTPASQYTTVKLARNVQTTNGWLMGLAYADALSASRDQAYFAYWFMITSASFSQTDQDPLTPLARHLLINSNAVAIHPALTSDSSTHWTHLFRREKGPRRTWMIDNIASLWRASWFDENGRFDKLLTYAWGIDLETCWKARQQDRSIWVHDDVLITKTTDIGYKKGRMNMSGQERRVLASQNMADILGQKFGSDWQDRMMHEYVEAAWQ